MHLSSPVEQITATDDEIRAVLEDAEAALPPLVASLAHLTGDRSVLRDDLAPDALALATGQGLDARQSAELTEIALRFLRSFRDRGLPAVHDPTDGELEAIATWSVGGGELAEYLPLLREELSVTGDDLRAPGWRMEDLTAESRPPVAIVGAGMSGLLAAHRLDQAGVPFVVLEKNHDVGGTWLENTYPGCRVDVPNHSYSYSFAQTDDWTHHYSTQPTLLAYFQRCAEHFDLRRHIRFGTEVTSATFDESTANWTLEVVGPDGEQTIVAMALISAVGQLNRPKLPEIPGRDTFSGISFHSARWPADLDLAGHRVCVVGNAASAMQFIPVIAGEAHRTTVFQRTPNWLVPTPDYHDEVSDGLRWLLRHVPGFAQWYRFWLFWRLGDGTLPACYVLDGWNMEESVGPGNELLRQLMLQYLREQFGDDPDLLEQVTPHYPPAAKRAIRDNGIWASTLRRDDVDLVTEAIEEIVPEGVRTADGEVHPADVIVYGTGFTASEFLVPMKVVGRGGVDLHEQWDGNARAHCGVTIPGFPNLFLLYGPNTNIVINGSIVFFSECEVRYVLDHIRHQAATGARALDCRREVHDEYNRWIDEGNAQRTWGVSDVSSWYKSPSGRVAQNWPYTLLEYWRQTLAIDSDHYEAL